MPKINQLTAKGQSVRAHLDKCDHLVRGVTDPVVREVLDELIDAVDELVANDGPCWELGET